MNASASIFLFVLRRGIFHIKMAAILIELTEIMWRKYLLFNRRERKKQKLTIRVNLGVLQVFDAYKSALMHNLMNIVHDVETNQMQL